MSNGTSYKPIIISMYMRISIYIYENLDAYNLSAIFDLKNWSITYLDVGMRTMI